MNIVYVPKTEKCDHLDYTHVTEKMMQRFLRFNYHKLNIKTSKIRLTKVYAIYQNCFKLRFPLF